MNEQEVREKMGEPVQYLTDMPGFGDEERPPRVQDERRVARERKMREMRTIQKRNRRISDASRRANRKK